MASENRGWFIRTLGDDWRQVPSGVIEEASHFLNGGTDDQIIDYAARVMNLFGPYEAEYRDAGPDDSLTITKTVSGAISPRAPGDPILTLPEGSRHPGARLVAHYINPNKK